MRDEIVILNEAKIFDTVMLYQFLRKLVTPFEDTKAFELGLIDQDGNILKKRKELKTTEEKDAFTMFDLLVWNIKKIIMKIPGGRSKIATFAAAFFLLKEQINVVDESEVETLSEGFMDYLYEIEADVDTINSILAKAHELDIYELAANISAGGHIAGLPPDEPVIRKQRKKKDKDDEDAKTIQSFRKFIST